MIETIAAWPHNPYFWYTVSFIIFGILAWKLGRAPVTEGLDARIEAIRKEVKAAEDLRIEAQALLAQYERRQRDAVKEVEKILAIAKTQCDQYRTQAERDLADTLTAKRRRMNERVDLMRNAALADIRAQATEGVIDRTRALLAKKITKKAAGELIGRSIAQARPIAA